MCDEIIKVNVTLSFLNIDLPILSYNDCHKLLQWQYHLEIIAKQSAQMPANKSMHTSLLHNCDLSAPNRINEILYLNSINRLKKRICHTEVMTICLF